MKSLRTFNSKRPDRSYMNANRRIPTLALIFISCVFEIVVIIIHIHDFYTLCNQLSFLRSHTSNFKIATEATWSCGQTVIRCTDRFLMWAQKVGMAAHS